MNDLSIESLKQMNLVEFLTRHYGLEFLRRGATYECCSPFTGERRPSFFVRLVDGHWLFKDHSGGAGGSIFEFVQMKEKLGCFSEALRFVRKLVGRSICCTGPEGDAAGAAANGEVVPATERPYDVHALYERFREEDPDV